MNVSKNKTTLGVIENRLASVDNTENTGVKRNKVFWPTAINDQKYRKNVIEI